MSPAPPPAPWRFDAIGTTWEIVTHAPLPAEVRTAVEEVIDAFDATWSRFRDDSTVRMLARDPQAIAAPADAASMLDVFSEVADATGGAVTPLVGDSLAHLGYDAGYSFFSRGARTAPVRWRELLTWDGGVLRLSGRAQIDVGALGKGRLVDLVLAVVAAAVPGGVVVDAGGDIAVRRRAERIALEHPFDASRAVGVWEVTDAALCASATNRRAWGDGLHHVLDARTGLPVRTVAATWAIAPTAMWADALATALFFDGGARLAAERGVEWVRMTTDGRLEWSAGCSAELFVRPSSVEG